MAARPSRPDSFPHVNNALRYCDCCLIALTGMTIRCMHNKVSKGLLIVEGLAWACRLPKEVVLQANPRGPPRKPKASTVARFTAALKRAGRKFQQRLPAAAPAHARPASAATPVDRPARAEPLSQPGSGALGPATPTLPNFGTWGSPESSARGAPGRLPPPDAFPLQDASAGVLCVRPDVPCGLVLCGGCRSGCLRLPRPCVLPCR